MSITLSIINKIRQIVCCFETGKTVGADYGAIALLFDGPKLHGAPRRQITYGASQTTEYGNLKILIKMYMEAKGRYAAEFKSFIDWIGDPSRNSLSTSTIFLQLLRDAAKDPTMQQTQDRFFVLYYFNPARQWFDKHGFTLPLSLLVIYDSYVHSGSMRDFLMNEFAENKPAAGGDEKNWITLYVDARDKWLENHSQQILQNTDYRTDSFINAIRKGQWDLVAPFDVVNYLTKDENDTPKVRATIA